RPAFERGHGPDDADLALRLVDRDFGTRGDVAALLRAASQSVAAVRAGWFAPAELLGGRFEDGPQPVVAQVLETEGERVHPGGLREVVHVRLAGEVVRRGG